MKTCCVEGCNNKHSAKGYCGKHYQQIKRYGRILDRTKFDPNEIIIHDDYAGMIIYDKNNKEIAKVNINLEDIEKVIKYKWYIKDNGYVYNKKVGYLHRYIMNCPDDKVVDHINHNKLDNRKCNLRICTQSQNQMNRCKQSNNTSGYTGVHFDESNNKWYAQISIDGKRTTLSVYETKEEAIKARKEAEKKYYGEYTRGD